MYFVIEQKDQLDKMSIADQCFIQIVPNNNNYHPSLCTSSLVYYNDFKKGYIFVIDHTEGFSLDINLVQDFLNQHKKIYLLDKKYHSYYLTLFNVIDLHFVRLNQVGKHDPIDCSTQLHKNFYQSRPEDQGLNKIIPISKHYEQCECLFNDVSRYVELETSIDIENRLSDAYGYVEKSGLKIDKLKFKKYFKTNKDCFSIKEDIIYNLYNLYNITGRPTNAFNGVNFLAIPKDPDIRQCFIPQNDLLVEFDFDAYHLRLIAKLIDYECPKESMHQMLGKFYFNKSELTDEEYKSSKEITFRQLYGGIEEQYKNIEFFSRLNNFIEKEWKKFNKFGAVVLSTGRTIKKKEGLNKLRLFNYIIQNLETEYNLIRIEELKQYLNDKKTKLVLITYDSFLFDYSIEDGKQTLIDVKNILQKNNMLVKYKYGKNYSF